MMTLTPQQARARLAQARSKMSLASKIHRGREGFDVNAGVTAALEEVIRFLEDALT